MSPILCFSFTSNLKALTLIFVRYLFHSPCDLKDLNMHAPDNSQFLFGDTPSVPSERGLLVMYQMDDICY